MNDRDRIYRRELRKFYESKRRGADTPELRARRERLAASVADLEAARIAVEVARVREKHALKRERQRERDRARKARG